MHEVPELRGASILTEICFEMARGALSRITKYYGKRKHQAINIGIIQEVVTSFNINFILLNKVEPCIIQFYREIILFQGSITSKLCREYKQY